MSREGYRGPKLPSVLLDKVQGGGVSKGNRRDVSRRDRRKAERQAKKTVSHRPQQVREYAQGRVHGRNGLSGRSAPKNANATSAPVSARTQLTKDAKPAKSILKRKEPPQGPDSESDDGNEGDLDLLDESEDEEQADVQAHDDFSELTVPRQSKRKLEEDDAEIAALEKKLGIKGKKSKASKDDDGLDWLAGGSDSEGEDAQRPEDVDWLKSKRRKASGKASEPPSEESDEDGSAEETDEHAQDGFEGFDSEDEEGSDDKSPLPPPSKRENPYVAPGAGHGTSSPAGKYIPPSLRKAATSDEEMLRQLHRQVQGKVNKVSESNMLSILKEVEDIYKTNARQHVTSTLIDILIGLMTVDVAHPDTVLITNAAFAAAVYKVIGTDFGAQLLERIVERYDHFNGRSIGDAKQPLNLLAFLCYLYNFQVVGCGILFDYIRLLLTDELTETSTERVLRVMRISGPQLRQDDPSALKDIVMMVQKLVSHTGEENLSVRTKFMIETIHNLKNNKMKTGLAASTIVSEQTTRMKKTLGTLNARAKATEPLRITLADIIDTEKKGEWWLVGASYHDPSKLASNSTPTTAGAGDRHDEDAGYQSSTPGTVNLSRLARQRGMNTDVRRAIFISLLSASDVQDAHICLNKLRLKNKQMLEIPRVITSCVGGEEAYNPYYALVARKLCGSGGEGGGAGGGKRDVRKAFQFGLWGFWRDVEKEADGEGVEGRDGEMEVSVRKVVNLAKFYAALVADGSLSLAVLKKLDFGYGMPEKETMFVEVFITSLLFSLHRGARKGKGKASDDPDAAFEESVWKTFSPAGVEAEVLRGLVAFVQTAVAGSELARTKKEKKALSLGCKVAVEALRRAAESSAPLDDGDSSGGEDSE